MRLTLNRIKVAWPPRLLVRDVQTVMLFLMPLTGFLGHPTLPTWRIANIVYVVLGLLFFRISNKHKIAFNLLVFQFIFLIAVGIQYLGLGNSYNYSTYDFIWIVSVLLLFAMSQLFFLQIQKDLNHILNIFYVLAVCNIYYQLYQQVMVQLHWYMLATILNEYLITYGNTFFKIIGGVLGSPGFMVESGHLALFLAPLIGFQLVADYYKILPLRPKVVTAMAISLALTISGGAFLQFSILAVLLLIIYRDRFDYKKLLLVCGLVSGLVIIFLFFKSYRDALMYRIMSVFEQDSGRFMGAKVFWHAFTENPLFGLGPKSARFIGADPNFFLTTVLADHGIFAGAAVFLLYFCPVVLAFVRSKHKLFIMPYLALTVHLFLAYGTFTWSFIWMHICLIIWGLAYAKPNEMPIEILELKKS